MLGRTIRNRKTVRVGAQMVAEEVRPKEFESRSLGRLIKLRHINQRLGAGKYGQAVVIQGLSIQGCLKPGDRSEEEKCRKSQQRSKL